MIRRRPSQRFCFALGSVVVVLALAACQRATEPDREGPPEKPFVVAIPTYPGFVLPFLANDRGLFEGVRVELKRLDDSAAINSGLIRGDIDATFTSVDAFALAAAAGVQAVAVLLSDESLGADGIVATSRITTLEDLRGKRVAANLGWPGHFFLLYNLKEAGIPFDDVPIINMDADKAGSAFISGDLDAAVTWEPWLSTAVSSGKGRVLLSTADRPGIILDPMIVAQRSLDARRAEVQAFVNGYYEALKVYEQDPQSSIDTMAAALGLPAEDFTAMSEGFRFIAPSEAAELLGPEGAVSQLFSTAAGIWQQAGVIENDVASEDRTTSEFVETYLGRSD